MVNAHIGHVGILGLGSVTSPLKDIQATPKKSQEKITHEHVQSV